jgi:predicted NAD-dependent protein-ADP-ribosyltransferase YbiA (DUF1768 family)
MNEFYSATYNVKAKSVEHLFQAAKFWWKVQNGDSRIFYEILAANTCDGTKFLANQKYRAQHNAYWHHPLNPTSPLLRDPISQRVEFRNEALKAHIMIRIVREKFQDPILRNMLLQTGNSILVEDSPKDDYFGMINGVGKNILGKILMAVREEIQTANRSTNYVPQHTSVQPTVFVQPQIVTPAPVLGNKVDYDAEIRSLKNKNDIKNKIIIFLLILCALQYIF